MKKFTEIKLVDDSVETGILPLKTDLIYLTENNTQVGSLLLVYDNKVNESTNRNECTVYSLEVLENKRGKGYGKKLMEKAISYCKSNGISEIKLNTELDNPANRLYKRLGFELIGNEFGFNNYTLKL